jgi:FlaA1/EpsC-like NDP-sugar epimerase
VIGHLQSKPKNADPHPRAGFGVFCYHGHMREHPAVLDKRSDEELILTYPKISKDDRQALTEALDNPRISYRVTNTLEEVRKHIRRNTDADRIIADSLMNRLVAIV